MNTFPSSRWFHILCGAMLALIITGANIIAADEVGFLSWQKPYTGEEATGDQVIALWQFDEGSETRDSSGRGHTLRLRGQSRFVKLDGQFGSVLESFPAGSDNDKPQGAVTARHPDLSPSGAFTLEMWIRPKPEMKDMQMAFLLDNKYIFHRSEHPRANAGYMFFLQKVSDKWQPTTTLGFGKDSEAYRARLVNLEAGTWYHIAFTYDGAGRGRFYLNGKDIGGQTHEGRGAITPALHPLIIGGRVGSTHIGFAGYIAQVRISNDVVPFVSGPLSLSIETENARTAFVRMEKDIHLQVSIMNNIGQTLTKVTARVYFGGGEQEIPLSDLAPKKTHTVEVPLDTSVRPHRYELKVTVSGTTADGIKYEAKESLSITIVSRPLPQVMPVIMWHGNRDLETMKEIGFTHELMWMGSFEETWSAGKPIEPATAAKTSGRLDRALVAGIGIVGNVNPVQCLMRNEQVMKKLERIDREGKHLSGRLCASFPEVQAYAYNVGVAVAQTWGYSPAFQSVLISTEVRDGTRVCFHEHDRQAFRKFAGFDIPDEVVSKLGVHHSILKDFPANRIIPDDDPILTFYRWFWKDGDGWNPLFTQAHKGLKSTGRDDLWTFHDPAVRVPSIWGSGGEVDVISHWTYTYPDPLKIGATTDELLAMADGALHDQQVMKMTQIIWYRSHTAPELPQDETKHAQWEKDIPDARFITIAPDHLRQAFWSKLSRPIQGIMYHGWASLVPAEHPIYRFTNPKTRGVLTELIRDVVHPLGPMLLQVPDRKSDVALLKSFTSQIFTGRGGWGWGWDWGTDMHLILQWAQLQPQVIFEETLLRDGLDSFRVLVMPHADVLTESVYRKIAEFQKKGGIIIADEHLTPALSPDIFVMSYRRGLGADADKVKVLRARAADLRQELDAFYQRYGDSSSPDVVVRFRQYRNTDYLFAVNDKRTFGTYVGHHGLVMEKGLPTTATLSVRRKQGYVYDLLAHKPVPVTFTEEGLEFKASFGPGAGRLFMITDRKIDAIYIKTPADIRTGDKTTITIEVVDNRGRRIDAVVPLKVDILDPENQPAEFSGFYGAKDGRLTIDLDIASNDLAGMWKIQVRCLASGLTTEYDFRVKKY